ncbi:unnamed protein product, partial [Aphanomyces euteiches]
PPPLDLPLLPRRCQVLRQRRRLLVLHPPRLQRLLLRRFQPRLQRRPLRLAHRLLRLRLLSQTRLLRVDLWLLTDNAVVVPTLVQRRVSLATLATRT